MAFELCCGRFLHAHEIPLTAEALMRSRYSAYVLQDAQYLLSTWYPSKRPETIDFDDKITTKWIGLNVKRAQTQDDNHATVEFIARYTLNGKAYRMHEISQFIRENGRWFYLEGKFV